MNDITRQPYPLHPTTQAAEGLQRRAWTLEEFERLSQMGFFGGLDGPRERLELVDGELVPMNAKGARHEWVRGEVQNYLAALLPKDFRLFNEPGWRPGGDRYLEPEMIICKAGLRPSAVSPEDVLLLIEVADSSLAYDMGTKAQIYATLGVGEYWVINATTLSTRVHLQPTVAGYSLAVDHPSTTRLQPYRMPTLSVQLSDLGLD